MTHSDSAILPPRGKRMRLYAQASTLREAAELLLRDEAAISQRIDDEDLWRPDDTIQN